MKTEQEEDSVLYELPVYLSKSNNGLLYVMQYPVRPSTNDYDENIIKARVKPKSKQIEVELGLDNDSPTFDQCKGEQISLNVDGPSKDKHSEDNYYSSSMMDKLVLTSSDASSDVSRYAVGVIGEEAVHLTPISCIANLRSSFSYLDKADKRSKNDAKDHSDDSDSEDKAKKVTVRFEKPDTERSISLREKSYGYLQKKIREEPWIPVTYHKYGSHRSEFESRNLFCSYQKEIFDQFTLENEEYLEKLILSSNDDVNSKNKIQSLPDPNNISLLDRLRIIMLNALVATFSEIHVIVQAMKEEGEADVLKVIQQVAVLVQGNWVVKSDILYPKEKISESKVSNDILHKVRDYILCSFSRNATINRSDFVGMLDIPGDDLLNILKCIAKSKGKGVWTFLLPTDNGFLKKFPDVVQRQQMIWQSRSEQLSHTIKDKMDVKSQSCKKRKIKQEVR